MSLFLIKIDVILRQLYFQYVTEFFTWNLLVSFKNLLSVSDGEVSQEVKWTQVAAEGGWVGYAEQICVLIPYLLSLTCTA